MATKVIVNIPGEEPYDVRIGAGVLDALGARMHGVPSLEQAERVLVVTGFLHTDFDLRKRNKDGLEGAYNFVENWVKTVKRRRIVIFPVNSGNTHWLAIVADIKLKKLVVLDSYHASLFEYLENIRYIMKMATGEAFGIDAVTNYGPRQRGSSDCGVFVCMAINAISWHFGQVDLPEEANFSYLKQILANIPQVYFGTMRKQMVYDILRGAVHPNPKPLDVNVVRGEIEILATEMADNPASTLETLSSDEDEVEYVPDT